MSESGDYRLLLNFVDTYLNSGFKGIDREDPLPTRISSMMAKHNQFFYIADMIQLKILYTCTTIKQVLGVEPSDFDPGTEFASTHPDDMQRHAVARSNMVKICNDLFSRRDDYVLVSTNLRFQHAAGHYINFIVQAYAFTNILPNPSIYCLFIKTDIDWFGPIKHGYNFYHGRDMSYFRIPDKELIQTGVIFTEREFEILKEIRDGLDSHAIGEKLFISPHTVDTHRRNILKKTGFHHCTELIIDLQERGFF